MFLIPYLTPMTKEGEKKGTYESCNEKAWDKYGRSWGRPECILPSSAGCGQHQAVGPFAAPGLSNHQETPLLSLPPSLSCLSPGVFVSFGKSPPFPRQTCNSTGLPRSLPLHADSLWHTPRNRHEVPGQHVLHRLSHSVICTKKTNRQSKIFGH